MRLFLFIILLTLTSIESDCQRTEVKNQVEVAGTLFYNRVFLFSSNYPYQKPDWETGLQFGGEYNKKIKERLWLTTEFCYMYAKVSYYWKSDNVIEPWMMIEESKNYAIQSGIDYYFLRWLYSSIRIIADYQYNTNKIHETDDQSGIGLAFASGVKLSFLNQIYIKAEPSLSVMSIISFKPENEQEHLLIKGLTCKLGYAF
jgi:hypothetical protein